MKQAILLVIFLLLMAVPVYFFVYCMIALRRDIRHFPKAAVKHKFAVLIPARNEEMVIGNLVHSLMLQNYPKEAFEVYALINHCTDATEKTAVENGAKVIHCDGTKTKGEVLHKAFQQLMKDPSIEAFVIMDADNLADPEFLSIMNDTFSCGYQLIQGRRTGKNVRSWVSCCYEVFYILQNIFFNHARTSMNMNASFNGTAWLIGRKYLQEHGYSMYTMIEDVELISQVALQNEKIMYTHDAVVYDEYPEDMKTSFRQLDRWIFGQVQCMRRYAGKLIGNVFKTGSKASLDMAFILTMPVTVILGLVIFILWLCNSPSAALFTAKFLWLFLVLLYIGMIFFLSAAIHKNSSSVSQLRSGVLCFPIFVLSWLILAPVNLFRRSFVWKPVEHNVSRNIEDMK